MSHTSSQESSPTPIPCVLQSHATFQASSVVPSTKAAQLCGSSLAVNASFLLRKRGRGLGVRVVCKARDVDGLLDDEFEGVAFGNGIVEPVYDDAGGRMVGSG